MFIKKIKSLLKSVIPSELSTITAGDNTSAQKGASRIQIIRSRSNSHRKSGLQVDFFDDSPSITPFKDGQDSDRPSSHKHRIQLESSPSQPKYETPSKEITTSLHAKEIYLRKKRITNKYVDSRMKVDPNHHAGSAKRSTGQSSHYVSTKQ